MQIAPEIRAAAEVIGKLEGEERQRALDQLKLLIPQQANESAPEPTVRALRDYLAVDMPEPPSIIEPALIVRGELTITIGRAGKGKTTMNLHRLLRWAGGLPMFDELENVLAPKSDPVRVLVIENEGAAAFFQEKMRVMLSAEGYMPREAAQLAAENFMVWGDGGYQGFRIDNDAAFDQLRRATAKHKPDVVFLEPFRTLWSGNENDATEMVDVLHRFSTLATEAGVAILVAHHERKAGAGDGGDPLSAGRGSSALEGHVAVWESFTERRDEDLRELSWAKARYGLKPAPIRMKWNANTKFYDYVPPEAETAPVIDYLRTLEGNSAYAAEVSEALAIPQDRARELLNRLDGAGRVRKGKRVPGERGIPYTLVDTDDIGGMKF